jgi:hypothetical protein
MNWRRPLPEVLSPISLTLLVSEDTMGSKTADHNPAPANGMDYPEHNRSYSGFITGVKWACYGGAALMIILYFLIIH